ncbi:MAG: hypothetical protein H7A31_02950 [Thermotogae bacterium]|nr:hypothetical protein [Thermotogota bacterium]MCP5465633.1 hypothetical protein [Thermotogota bacterium]
MKSRHLFSDSLDLLFDNNKYEAKLKLNEALSGEVYIEDIPKFLYYSAKLDLQLGQIDKAKESLNNILLFSAFNEDVETLSKFVDSVEEYSLSNFSTPNFINLFNVEGNKETFERFYTVTDSEVLNSGVYILDSQNKLIFKQSNDNSEKWIKLDKKYDYYSLSSDSKLDRIYLGTSEGLMYFNSYGPGISGVASDMTEVESSEGTPVFLVKGFDFISYGVDSAGRIIGYNPSENSLNIVGFDGSMLQKKTFNYNNMFVSGTVWRNYVYLLEYYSKSLYVYNIITNDVEKIIKLPYANYLDIDILPWGYPVLSSIENGIEIYDLKTEKPEKYDFEDKNMNSFRGNIKIKYGIMLMNDSVNFKVYVNRINSKNNFNSLNINLYGLLFRKDDLDLKVRFNITDLSGNNIEYLTKNIYVQDSGGRVAFGYQREFSRGDIYFYDSADSFFETGISQIDNNSFIIVSGNLKKQPEVSQIIPLLMSGSYLFYLSDTGDVNEILKNIIYTSGGSILITKDKDYIEKYLKASYKVIETINYKLYNPIIEGIKQTKIVLEIGDKKLSDTLYYYTEGVESGR